ncbi:MAG TPA: metal-dependent hydrolase [Rhizomicrobium sp.]|nr:metal-dependent hydrolase [Rhizomicrobium sp.]
MNAHSSTPEDLSITSRDLAFGRKVESPRHWLGGDPIATAFYNALSASFPQGERFFMDSVRNFKSKADPKLQQQIVAFTTQEALHTREHVFFNQQIAGAGYDLSKLDKIIKKRLDFGRTRPKIEQLGATIALEHFTAILAHEALKNPAHFADATPEAQRMWKWHAIEEIEHKSVAYDTFLAATKNLPGWQRYFIRVRTMIVSTFMFFEFLFRGIAYLFQQDGINTPSSWLKMFRFMLFKPGMIGRVIPAYFQYYRPGFHPWYEDDRGLIAETEQALGLQAVQAA